MKRNLYVGVTFAVVLIALAIGSALLQKRVVVHAAGGTQAPRFEVDPMWPKPLPNHWLLGQTIGVSVDSYDHIWIIHRGGSLEPGEQHASATPQIAQCCAAAPPVLEFDEEGNLIGHWGGPGQRLRLAGIEPWNHCRLQGQRLDWRQRTGRTGWWPRPWSGRCRG